MLRSMTGYGRGEYTLYDRKIVVEIKSVNHRYNDLNIKIPRIMNGFEDKLRKKLSAFIQRGKTDVYVSMETFSKADVQVNVNEALALAYVEALRKVKACTGLAGEVPLQMVAQFPDVVTVAKDIDDEQVMLEIWEILEQAAMQAVARLVAMRETEGEALKNDLLSKADGVRALIEKLKERQPFVLAEYRQRLKANLEDMLGHMDIDENRILTEVAVFADRTCIDEEITRFGSHINQLNEILLQKDAVGRKLDFLVQEMNREINTIGSKANDLETSKIVVDLKSEIEKIREQVQNIE